MTRVGKIFMRIRQGLSWLEESFLCLLLLAMIILACLQIVLRDVFSGGLLWADPLLRYLVIWAGLFGADLATKRGKHIAIDIASHLIPPRLEPWLAGLINLFSASVCIGLTYAAIVFVKNEAAIGGGREIIGISSWAMNVVFPLAFSLISCRFVILAFTGVAEIIKAQRRHS